MDAAKVAVLLGVMLCASAVAGNGESLLQHRATRTRRTSHGDPPTGGSTRPRGASPGDGPACGAPPAIFPDIFSGGATRPEGAPSDDVPTGGARASEAEGADEGVGDNVTESTSIPDGCNAVEDVVFGGPVINTVFANVAATCCAICTHAGNGCRAWDYHGASFSCFLIAVVTEQVDAPGFVSGSRNLDGLDGLAVEYDVDYPGDDFFSVVPVFDFVACANLCGATAGLPVCLYWSWSWSTSRCFLKHDRTAAPRIDPDFVSGTHPPP